MEETFLNHLTVQDCLGSGSFGIVFAAQSTLTLQFSAVKFVCKESNLSEKERLELDRESTLFRHLPGHPNVVKVMDVVEKEFGAAELKKLWNKKLLMTEEQHVIRDQIIGMAKRHDRVALVTFQMELCGTTLRHWLRDDRIRELDAPELHYAQFKILRDCWEGLKFLHRNNIIHRDIKPENLMFSVPSREYAFPLKVGDFGLCRLTGNPGTKSSSLTSKVGTWDYMAPEVVHGRYGQQCDIYSFGLVAWEVIQLIPGTSRGEMFDALTNDRQYDLIQDHPAFAEIKDLIIMMTMRKVRERMRCLENFKLSYIDVREVNSAPTIQNMEVGNEKHIVKVYVGGISDIYEIVSVEATKNTTAEQMVKCLVQKLDLKTSSEYELVAVVKKSWTTGHRETERRVLRHESPVALTLGWPKETDATDQVPMPVSLLARPRRTQNQPLPKTRNDETTRYRYRLYLKKKLHDSTT